MLQSHPMGTKRSAATLAAVKMYREAKLRKTKPQLATIAAITGIHRSTLYRALKANP